MTFLSVRNLMWLLIRIQCYVGTVNNFLFDFGVLDVFPFEFQSRYDTLYSGLAFTQNSNKSLLIRTFVKWKMKTFSPTTPRSLVYNDCEPQWVGFIHFPTNSYRSFVYIPSKAIKIKLGSFFSKVDDNSMTIFFYII